LDARVPLAENCPDCGNRREQPNNCKGSTYGLPLLRREPVGNKEGDSSAEHSAGSYDECEFWPAEMDFLHDSAKIVEFTRTSNKECRLLAPEFGRAVSGTSW